MDINEIKNLPDRVPTETLISMFQNALNQFENNEIKKDNFLLTLSQLTDRQTMTYELLRSDIRNDIDRTLSRFIFTYKRLICTRNKQPVYVS